MNKSILISAFLLIFICGYSVSYVAKPGEVESIASCQHLSKPQAAFALHLSALHRDLFCKRFNESQRAKTMAYADQFQGADAEDLAVEQVLQESRGQQTVPRVLEKYYDSPCYQQRKNGSH